MIKFALSLAAFFIISGQYLFSFSGNGLGSEADPYQITSIEQLQEMNEELDAHYVLMNDIDASETENWNEEAGFDPIGNYTKRIPKDGFTGYLDGQDYAISNLYIDRPNEDCVGLFGCIADGSYVHNVSVEDADVTGDGFVGIFVGSTYAFGEDTKVTIENCSSSGSAKGRGEYSNVIGGFCGYNHGYFGTARISNCNSLGEVISNGNNIGGFCGYNSTFGYYSRAIINNCTSNCTVTGKGSYDGDNIGGFCGYNSAYSQNSEAIIGNCTSSGTVTGKGNTIGGFCGRNSGYFGMARISDCNSTGDATGNGGQSRFIGGFCGGNDSYEGTATIRNCNSSGTAKGNSYSIGGFCGWNLAYSGVVNLDDCNSTGDAIGINDNSYNIGGFCGNNHAYSNGAVVNISYCYSTGNAIGKFNVGGFCGQNDAIYPGSTTNISCCYSTGNATGNEFYNSYIGGFCGTNYASFGTVFISNCYSAGDAAGNGYDNYRIAGFCGANITSESSALSKIVNCYSIGSANGNKNLGGFCSLLTGEGYEEIKYCYWDTQTSGMTTSDGGEGKTTAEMMIQATFTDWDFNSIWCMAENQTYPQLQYFVDCDNLVGVKDLEYSSQIKVYPNPAEDFININCLDKDMVINKVCIINLMGNIIKEYSFDYQTIIKLPTADILTGYYFVQINTNDNFYSIPIVIKH